MTSHKEWLANYRTQKEQERSEREARNSKLATTRLNDSTRDEVLVKAFEMGVARSKAAAGPLGALGRHARRFIGNSRRLHPASPDRAASLQRKRKWGGSSCLPDWMRQHYTEGERAVLAVVVQRAKRYGHCDLAINAIAALAGVHRTTVQNALRRARHLKHVAIQERPGVAGQLSLTNVIRILCGAWKAWLRRVGSGFKKLNPSEMKREKKASKGGFAPSQGAYEEDEEAFPLEPQRERAVVAPASRPAEGSRWFGVGGSGVRGEEPRPLNGDDIAKAHGKGLRMPGWPAMSDLRTLADSDLGPGRALRVLPEGPKPRG